MEVVAAARAVDVKHLAGREDPFGNMRCHRVRVEAVERGTAPRDLRLPGIADARDGEPEVLEDARERLAGQLRGGRSGRDARRAQHRLRHPPLQHAIEEGGGGAPAERRAPRTKQAEELPGGVLREEVDREDAARLEVAGEIEDHHAAHAIVAEEQLAALGGDDRRRSLERRPRSCRIHVALSAEEARRAAHPNAREAADGFRGGCNRGKHGHARDQPMLDARKQTIAAPGGHHEGITRDRLPSREHHAHVRRPRGRVEAHHLVLAALLHAQTFAFEAQDVEHRVGHVRRGVDASLGIGGCQQAHVAEEATDGIAPVPGEYRRHERGDVVGGRRDGKVGEVAAPVAAREDLLSHTGTGLNDRHVRAKTCGRHGSTETSRATADDEYLRARHAYPAAASK